MALHLVQKITKKINNALSIDLIALLIVVGVVVYVRSLFNGFVGDDMAQIVQNEAIKHVDSLITIFGKGTFTTGGATAGLGGVYYKPLMTFFYVLIYSGFGLMPFAYHLLSLLTHITNVVLLFFVSRSFFRMGKFTYAQAAAFFLSLIFLIHPGNSEAVLYIADMQDLLTTHFLLLSLLICLSIMHMDTFSWKRRVFLGLALFLGMLSKESGVVALVLVPSFLYLFSRQFFKTAATISVLVFVTYLFFRYQVAHIPLFQTLSFIPIHAATLTQRIMTIPYELFSYFRLIVFPNTLFLYQHDVVLQMTDPKFYLTLPIIVVAGGTLIFLSFRLRSKFYVYSLLWMLLGFGIVTNIIPLDMTLEERWLYLPFIGVLWAVFFIGQYISQRWNQAIVGAIIVVVLLMPWYMVRSFIRSGDFQNNYTLYSHDIRLNPYSYELLTNYGVSLIEAGRYQKAADSLQLAIQRSPQYWPAYNNLGLAYEKLGNNQKAKQYYWLAIGMSHYFVSYENLANLTFRTEKPQFVLPIVQQSLPLYPNNVHLLTITAKTYKKLGMIQQAQVYAQKAFLLDNSIASDPDIAPLITQ